MSENVERIIVATAGGDAAATALDWAIARAVSRPSRLELVTVAEDLLSLVFGATGGFRTVYAEALEQALARVKSAAPSVPVGTALRDGTPARELVRASAEADLVVLGTDKVGKVTGALYGTLPLRVAAASACPTAIVPVNWAPVSGPIVVGLGDDTEGRDALEFAAREAESAGVSLVVVHAWSIPPVVTLDVLGPGDVVSALDKAHTEIAAKELARLRDGHPGLNVESVVKQGPAVEVVTEAAKGASLLVVGRHGVGALEGFVLGSVSHGVLLHPPCPVIVVP